MEEKSKLFSNNSNQSEPVILSDHNKEVKELAANAIAVNITSPEPIVVFFGPPAIGKSVTLIRLCRYLKYQKKLIIEPDEQFRKDDPRYKEVCKTFEQEYMEAPKGPESTGEIDFLLIKVKDRQKGNLCQVLEAPGEHFFVKKETKDHDYPPYLYRIINNEIPKIYVFFLELDWEDDGTRKKYEDKIVNFKGNLGKNDSVIVLVNKADKQLHMIHSKKPIEAKFRVATKNQYKEIYDTFLKGGFLSAESYKSNFTVFSAGNFNNESSLFTESIEYYPEELWNKIRKRLKGGWLG